MNIKFKQCNKANYRPGRTLPIKYIVIHFTSNNGDTAEGNLNYFANNATKTSAHYFVDEDSICQAVKDSDTAYHCGAKTYKHPSCRNPNSIGIEMCSRKHDDGSYYIMSATVLNAAEITKALMAKYNIPINNVIRHYDVTGKNCPAPFVEHPEQWAAFKERLTKKEIVKVADKSIPSTWAEAAAKWAVENGLITGDTNGDYNWQGNLTREQFAVILKRYYDKFK